MTSAVAPSPLPVVMTLGDPAGVGPEVVARALAAHTPGPLPAPLIVGPMEALVQACNRLAIDLPLTRVSASNFASLPAGRLPIFDLGGPLPPLGEVSAEGGQLAIEAMDQAIALIKTGHASAIVTAPLSKEAVRLAGHDNFTGQTEYLAQATGTQQVRMLMASPTLKVVLVTTHHALAQVPSLIHTQGVFTTLEQTHAMLVQHGGIAHPRIAVCGLNCHPGEFGDEDAAQVTPAIEQAQEAGIDAYGPFSADALFPAVAQPRKPADHFDAVVAMYHDQGLIPVKLLGQGEVVNVTLGLPFIRTAPGHGTAYDLAGQCRADGTGMSAALALAEQWATPHPQVAPV